MKKLALAAVVGTALSFTPSPAAAQVIWQFDVPLNLQSLNQGVESVVVRCATFDHPAQDIYQTPIGTGDSGPITPDAQGNVIGTATVPVTLFEGFEDPGSATHYWCQIQLNANGSSYPPAGPAAESIVRKPRDGTQLVYRVSGTLP